MSEHDHVSALLGTAAKDGQGGDDYKAKYEEAMRQLQSAKVEQGRVAKLDAEKKALEKRLSDLQGALSPEERENLSPEFTSAAAKIAVSATEGVNAELAKIRQEREEEKAMMRRRMEEDFFRVINAKYPEFLANIEAGGKWNAAWFKFLDRNKGSVNDALASLDAEGLSYHVDRFYRESLEIDPRNGVGGNASAPDPMASRGGTQTVSVSHDKVYTSAEYDALEKKAMRLRAQGQFEEYAKLDRELASILADGRIQD